ncbi:Uncharacterised protein [Moraxella lacunata]|uniref:Uncharacterized protein n=1 Tax=Moraxella lacunata TaxID=477 RepID=A0A378TU06_MORLA|nr:hypothetical protein [Moraxella lacunata]STZ63372.1 Uncharacterised protein [Moraxella lacunata]
MIDIFVDSKYDTNQASNLMMNLFELDKSKIVVCRADELDKITVSDDISCLCVMSDVNGDVSFLLSLHIIEMDFELFVQKLSDLSVVFQNTFFIPCDDFNGYFKIHNKSVETVSLDEEHSDGKFVYFVN